MLFNDPFSTVHHYWNWFDAALLIPYFAVMIILALYGVHRYTLCYLYFKYRKNYNPNPPKHFDELPRVTVQLPIFNEQFVIDRLIEAVCAMEYPRERLEIQVLDDSTDETTEVASAIVARYAALGPSHRLHPPHQSPWLQGRCAGRGPEGRQGRICRHLRRRFCSPARLAHESHPPLRRAGDWHGADALDPPEPRLQHADPDRGHPAGRPLRDGARRPRPDRRLLQLQRHGRHVAHPGDLRRRRLAARYAHGRHRPELSLADGRLEIQIPAGGRVPLRAAHRDDRVQDAAGALGQGPDPDQHQGPAHDLQVERPAAHQDRGRLPPDRQHELPADGRSCPPC